MGLSKNGPITPYKGSWAEKMAKQREAKYHGHRIPNRSTTHQASD